MKNKGFFKPSLIVVAISLAFPLASAWADEVDELISPDTAEVSLNLLSLNKANPLYREYSGMSHKGVNGSLDFNFVKRSENGFWIRADGRDLGLRTQEFKAGVEQQGNWAVGFAYNQIPHFGPYEISTRVTGIGSNTLNLPASLVLLDQTLKTERTATSLTAKKFIYDNLVVNFSYKNEDKKGTRLMGANGNTIGSGFLGMVFAPEQIDSNHQQFEATVDYFTKKFQISAGYYGSFFKNNAGNALFVNYGTNSSGVIQSAAPTFQSPLSLAPDNHAQEFFVSGAYNWTGDTRTNLKLGKTFAVQDASFIPAYLLPAPIAYSATDPSKLTSRSSLGGKLDTTNIFASFTSRITKEFDVLASWAYEDQHDTTPIDVYGKDYAHGGSLIYNNPESQKLNRGKFEGTYRLPAGYSITAGYDFDRKEYPGMGELFRERVDEQTYRIDLRKSLSEVLNGSIRLAHSERDGSEWGSIPSPTSNTAFNQSPAVGEFWAAPTQFSDRKRDKARLMLDWLPLQSLSVQLAYEYSNDDYTTRVNNIGLKKGQAQLYSLDIAYQVSEKWKSSLWFSRSTNDINQGSQQSSFGRTCQNISAATTCVPWDATLRLTGDSLGLGFDGKINSRLEIGAKAFYTRDVNRYDITVSPLTNGSLLAGVGVVPDTVYMQQTVRLFGKYAVAKATTVRLDYIWDKREMDDYTWASWTYSDGTKVYVNPRQVTQILGVSLIQSF